MPLTSKQESYIRLLVETTFDLSNVNADSIRDAFVTKKVLALPEGDFSVEACIGHPEKYLVGVEKQNPPPNPEELKADAVAPVVLPESVIPAKVGEVLIFVMDLLKEKLKANWDRDELVKKIEARDDFDKEFVSHLTYEIAALAMPPALTVPERLFQVDMREDDGMFAIEAKIAVPDVPPFTAQRHLGPLEDFVDAEEEGNFSESDVKEVLETHKPLSETFAIDETAKLVLKRLVELTVISEQEASSISEAGKDLLTYLFYFNLIKDRLCKFSDIQQLSYYEFKSLVFAITMDLIKTGKCTVTSAKLFNTELLQIPFYYQQLFNNKLSAEYFGLLFHDLEDDEFANLTSPPIMRLIGLEALDFVHAKSMSPFCRKLLENEQYAKLFCDKRIKFQLIENLSEWHCNALLNPQVLADIYNGRDTIENFLAIDDKVALKMMADGCLKRADLAKFVYFPDQDLSDTPAPTRMLGGGRPRKLTEQFLQLAEEGLFLQADLSVFFENMTLLKHKAKAGDGKEEKNSLAELPALLENRPLQKALVANVKKRIDALHIRKPWKLPNGQDDRMETLVTTLKKYQIKSEEVWARLFSLRLIGVCQEDPYFLHDRPDDFAVVKKSMVDTVAELKMSLFPSNKQNKFDCMTKKYLILGLSEMHSEGFEPLREKARAVYAEALKKEKIARSNTFFDDNCMSAWKEAFETILKFAKAIEPVVKRQKTLESTTANNDFYDFCQRLFDMGECLDPVPTLVPERKAFVPEARSSSSSQGRSGVKRSRSV